MAIEVDAAAFTHIGMEDVCAQEVGLVLGVKPVIGKGLVRFRAPLESVCDFVYQTRSSIRVVVVLGEKKASDALLGSAKLVEETDLEGWLDNTTTFACRSSIPDIGTEVAAECGGILNDRTSAPVDLDSPSVTMLVHQADDTLLLCVDLSGDDLSKRDYRIFLGSDSLKGTLAYGLLSLAGYDGRQSLADIFCRSGIITIEAALLTTGVSPHKHDRNFAFRKLRQTASVDWDKRFDEFDSKHARKAEGTIVAMDESFGAVAATKKNAKIAGVHQALEFSRTDLQFLDAKFGKAGLDLIATMPPQPSARISGAPLDKALQQIFYQAEFILKKKGKLALITRSSIERLKELAQQYKFLLLKEQPVFQGQLELRVLIFAK